MHADLAHFSSLFTVFCSRAKTLIFAPPQGYPVFDAATLFGGPKSVKGSKTTNRRMVDGMPRTRIRSLFIVR